MTAELPILTVEVNLPIQDPVDHPTRVQGIQIQALDDTGATGNFISREIVDLLGLPIRVQSQHSISLGNQTTATCDGIVSCTIALDPDHPEHRVPLDAYVVKDLGFPLIIGHPFGVRYQKTPIYTETDGEEHLEAAGWNVCVGRRHPRVI